MANYRNNRFPYTQAERFDYFDANMYSKAEVILNEVYDGKYTVAEWTVLVRAIRELYLDRDNYPRSFNLRIARKFNSYDLNTYYGKARDGYRKYYDTTLNTIDGEFYFGFNHN